MTDSIARIGKGTMIQHGKQSDRIYLMKLHEEDMKSVADELVRLAEKERYSKIFCKIPGRAVPLFLAKGFLIEGYIPQFYGGREDGFFVSKFLSAERLSSVPVEALEHLYELLHTQKNIPPASGDRDGYSFRRLTPEDAPAMATVYSDVFESYPFPIHDPAYIMETMNEHVQYFGAFKDGCLAALASSEIDVEARNAEMTDFATHRTHTGHRLACRLLELMEGEMQRQEIATLYTIARLQSVAMNKTFLRMGYTYSGTLINNTQIAGGIETMNLYYKQLSSFS